MHIYIYTYIYIYIYKTISPKQSIQKSEPIDWELLMQKRRFEGRIRQLQILNIFQDNVI